MIRPLVALALLAFFVPSAAAVVSGTTPIAHWTFDESGGPIVHDSGPHHFDGTTAGTFAPGIVGSHALNLAGKDADLGAHSELQTPHVTVSLWIKGGGPSGYVISNGAFGGCCGSWAIYNGGATFYILTHDALIIGNAVPTPLYDGNWHHIVATYDGAAMMEYVDGALRSTTPATGNIDYAGSAPADLFVGDYAGSTGYGFGGIVDDLQIFDHALTAGQVAALDSPAPPAPLPELPTVALAASGLVIVGLVVLRRSK